MPDCRDGRRLLGVEVVMSFQKQPNGHTMDEAERKLRDQIRNDILDLLPDVSVGRLARVYEKGVLDAARVAERHTPEPT